MNKSTVFLTLSALVFGLGMGYWLAEQKAFNTKQHTHKQTQKALFYRNPMNPEITSSTPMKDSMGMDYIPVYEPTGKAENIPVGTVAIDGVTQQNIAVRTAQAKRKTLSHIVRAVGRVAYDEERMLRLHPKTEGWIEHLNVDKTGQWVEKNTDLLSIYSPKLVTSQQEYLLALNNYQALKDSPIADISKGAKDLLNSSLERLKLLDVPPHQLKDLQTHHKIRKSLHIHAPAEGVVMNIGVREGQYVTPVTELYMIADLRKVWVYAEIYEHELPWVKQGDPVEMRLAGIPGKTFTGRLTYIYPYAEPKTRTIKVRLAFDNPKFLLKPDMFAEVTIYASQQVNAVVIPAEAVLHSGSRKKVFVVREAGKFEPRTVKLGMASNNEVAILEGIQIDEFVVTSGQFLIDSESKLHEAAAKMLDSPSQSAHQRPAIVEHDHSMHGANHD